MEMTNKKKGTNRSGKSWNAIISPCAGDAQRAQRKRHLKLTWPVWRGTKGDWAMVRHQSFGSVITHWQFLKQDLG